MREDLFVSKRMVKSLVSKGLEQNDIWVDEHKVAEEVKKAADEAVERQAAWKSVQFVSKLISDK